MKMDQNQDECRSSGEFKQDDEEGVYRIEESRKLIEAKLTLRRCNLNPERPDPAFLRTLDSSIKRNTAVIKKLKQITEEQQESLMDELRGVNMSKFVTEAVVVISEAKIKSSDIPTAVQICSLLHQMYPDFSSSLCQSLLKVLFAGKLAEDLETERNTKAMKKRNTLKLLLELYFVAVIEDSSIFVSILKELASVEHLKDRDTTLTNLSLLATFARVGRALIGLPLSGSEPNEEFFRGLDVTADRKKSFQKLFHGYYDNIAEVLLAEHASLSNLEHDNAKVLNAKGELSDDNASSYEKLRKSYDSLHRGVTFLAEALDMQPPLIPGDGHTTRVTSGGDSASSAFRKESPTIAPLWDDEDTRTFYESLPDLRAFVPAVLFGEAESKGIEQSANTHEQSADAATESEHSPTATDDTIEPSSHSGVFLDGKVNLKWKKKEDKEKETDDTDQKKDSEKDEGRKKGTVKKGYKAKKKKGLDGTKLDALLKRLPWCVSRDLIDQLTLEFCYLNKKSRRKKLVRALFNVPRTSLELLPYYSRLVGTLSTCMKDISPMLLQLLEEEFNFLINEKDQMNIEIKIRNIRFIGELCKFKIAPPGLVFSCFKACLDDFTHHNIDVACNLLETCGRFLYRSPETTVRMSNMLEILFRLKNVKNLDSRHSTLVENAYYLCKPPERLVRVSKVRPPLHQYIRKLLFSDLDKSSVENVLRQLCKLPWSECEPYLFKCFLKVHRGKYGQIHLIASLTAGLSFYHANFAVAVVDEVLEQVRLGLEMNNFGIQQRRLAHMRFLGELHNYALVDSSVIFETLYSILVFGHGTAEQDVLDPPEDCFRIRLVMTLLETCGHYFDRGSCRRDLDRFLMHFQRYTLRKGLLPLDIEFDLQDQFADLRPTMTRYMSIEEVNTALTELDEYDIRSSNEKHLDIEKHSNTIKRTGMANVQRLRNGVDGYSSGQDVVGDSEISDTDSRSDSVSAEARDDGDYLYDESHDTGKVGLASDEDKEFRVRRKAQNLKPKEEDEFDRELKALMQESLEFRKLEMRSRPTLDMMIPINIFESGNDALEEEENGENRDVRVKVLVKRGHKQQTKQMYIPQECSLVNTIRTTKQKEAAVLEEKQDIKRLVLEYNDRAQEEIINEINNNLPGCFTRSGTARFSGRGSGGRHSSSRYPFNHHHSRGGYYYVRKK